MESCMQRGHTSSSAEIRTYRSTKLSILDAQAHSVVATPWNFVQPSPALRTVFDQSDRSPRKDESAADFGRTLTDATDAALEAAKACA